MLCRKRAGLDFFYPAAPVPDSPYEPAVAYILITGKRIVRLRDITPEDAQKEGGYTIEEFRREWEEINGKWRPDLEVYVYDFQLVKSRTV